MGTLMHRSIEGSTEDQLAELRAMLESSTGYHGTVVRPVVQTGRQDRCAIHGPGPVIVVTFYISDCDQETLIPRCSAGG